jgi:hypothetical protein
MILASPSTVNKFMNPGPVNLPRASAVPTPPVVKVTDRTDCCQGVKATTGSAARAFYRGQFDYH